MRIKGLFLLLVSGLAACGGDTPDPMSAKVERALGQHELALTEVSSGSYQLLIKKDALEHGSHFLLSMSLIDTSEGEPAFHGLQSHVVFFKQADGKVEMLEASSGTSVDAELVPPNVMATFPIASESDDALGLDFNSGTTTLWVNGEWTGDNPHDAGEKLDGYAKRFSGFEFVQRYVDEAKTDDAGRITIRQVAQAASDNVVQPFELRYFIRPYRPNPHYQVLVANQDFRWAGFFESDPVLVPGTHGSERDIIRFDPSRHLQYAISANTPSEVKQAVREGILYWNSVAGFDWIEVIDAPAGVTAPALDYNLVQWVDEFGAEFAYSDWQIDPLTGETQNVQIYLPSTFYQQIWQELPPALAQLAPPSMDNAFNAPALSADPSIGFGKRDQVSDTVARGMTQALLTRDLSDEARRRVALDYVRAVTAHEVGHTLGLNHNFAGSLGSNVSFDELDALRRDYYASGAWPEDKMPSSTIMEYNQFDDTAALGARIRLGYAALPYDVRAIAALYNGEPLTPDGPLFCSEDDYKANTFDDCLVYDEGSDIVQDLQRQISKQTQDAAIAYLQGMVNAKLSASSDLFAFTQPETDAHALYNTRFRLARLVSSTSNLVESDRAIGSPVLNAARIHRDSVQRAEASIRAAGGYGEFFGLLPADFDDTFRAKLKQLFDRKLYATSIAPGARNFVFNDDERARIEAFVPTYLARYHAAADSYDIQVLRLGNPVALDDGSNAAATTERRVWQATLQASELNALLAERVQHYISATGGTFSARVAADGGDTQTVSLPQFTYPSELRAQAPYLLAPKQSDNALWARELSQKGVTAFAEQLQQPTGVSFDKLVLDGSDEKAQAWIFDNRDVWNAFVNVQVN